MSAAPVLLFSIPTGTSVQTSKGDDDACGIVPPDSTDPPACALRGFSRLRAYVQHPVCIAGLRADNPSG